MAESGTRMAVSSAANQMCISCEDTNSINDGPTSDPFYVYFRNGTTLMEEMLLTDANTGAAVPSGVMVFEGVGIRGVEGGGVGLGLCFDIMVWLLL